MTGVSALVATILLSAAVLIHLLAGPHNPPMQCFEDEVIVWTGESHDECMAVDDLIDTDPQSVRDYLDRNHPVTIESKD